MKNLFLSLALLLFLGAPTAMAQQSVSPTKDRAVTTPTSVRQNTSKANLQDNTTTRKKPRVVGRTVDQTSYKPSSTPETRANNLTKHLSSKLGLSDVQTQRVYDLNINIENRLAALVAKPNDNPAVLKAQVSQLYNERSSSLARIFTAQQNKEYAKIKRNFKQKRSGFTNR